MHSLFQSYYKRGLLSLHEELSCFFSTSLGKCGVYECFRLVSFRFIIIITVILFFSHLSVIPARSENVTIENECDFGFEVWDFDYRASVLRSQAGILGPASRSATTFHRKIAAVSTSLSKGNCV